MDRSCLQRSLLAATATATVRRTRRTTHDVWRMNTEDGSAAAAAALIAMDISCTEAAAAAVGRAKAAWCWQKVERKLKHRQRLRPEQETKDATTSSTRRKVNNTGASVRMMTLDGDVRRRMTIMNNRIQRSSITRSASFQPLQSPPYSVSPLMLSPRVPSGSRSPHSLSDGSTSNSSSSCASSLQHHFYGGPASLFGDKRNNKGYGKANNCTALVPRDPLYKALAPWSPAPVISSSVISTTTVTSSTEMGDRRGGSRKPGASAARDTHRAADEPQEVFARKVFVGGLPIDVTEEEITSTFSQFGPVLVDWPRRPDITSKDKNASRYMTGYVFLVFEDERSVQMLVKKCHKEDEKYYLFVSSPTMRDKPVQVRPWRLGDMEFMLCEDLPLNPRRTIFIGGVPRPTKARELARVLDNLYGAVCYVGIDIDPELKYPKGAARVTFTTEQSFIAAISGRFVHIPHADMSKRVEIKPYVMDEQMCDECDGFQCAGRYAPYFCGDVTCLQYYCESCWDCFHYGDHSDERKSAHKPLVRVGDQTKLLAHPPHHNHTSGAKAVSTTSSPSAAAAVTAADCRRHDRVETGTCFTARPSQNY